MPTVNPGDRAPHVGAALGALSGWTVLVVQFNSLVAGRMGVTDSDLQCLFVLGSGGPSTAGALARRINLTTGSVSRMIDRLAAAGHVTRSPDPHDRRRVIITPTPASLDKVEQLYAPLIERLRADLDDFDAEQLVRLTRFAHAATRSTEAAIRQW